MLRATAAVPVRLCSQRREPVAPATVPVAPAPPLVAVAPVQRGGPALPGLLPTEPLLGLRAPVPLPFEPAAPATAPVAPALVAVAPAPRLWLARPLQRPTVLRGLASPPPRDAAPRPLDPL